MNSIFNSHQLNPDRLSEFNLSKCLSVVAKGLGIVVRRDQILARVRDDRRDITIEVRAARTCGIYRVAYSN